MIIVRNRNHREVFRLRNESIPVKRAQAISRKLIRTQGALIRWYLNTPCAKKYIQYRPCSNSMHVRKFVRFYLG